MARFLGFCFAWIKAIRHGAQSSRDLETDQRFAMHQAADKIMAAAGVLALYVATPKPSRCRKPVKNSRGSTPSARATPQLPSDDTTFLNLATRIDRKVRRMIKRDRMYRFGPPPKRPERPERVDKPAPTKPDQCIIRATPRRLLTSFETMMRDPIKTHGFRRPP